MKIYVGIKSPIEIFQDSNFSNDPIVSHIDNYYIDVNSWQGASIFCLTVERRMELNLIGAQNGSPIQETDFVDYPWWHIPAGRQPPDLNHLVHRLMHETDDIMFSREVIKIYPDSLERRSRAAFTTRFRSGRYIEFLHAGEIDQRLQQLDHFVRTWLNRPPDIVAAVCAMAEFLIIHPFVDGNGRAARLLFHLMMADRDGGQRIVPPLAPAIAHNRFAFISAMLACELDADVRPLCDFVCAALAATKAVIESSEPANDHRSFF